MKDDVCKKLYEAAHRLLYPDRRSMLDVAEWIAQRAEVRVLSATLAGRRGATPEEEGEFCLALLMGCAAEFDSAEHDLHVQEMLDRTARVLPELEPSLLKVRLLTYAYGETFEPSLADEALATVRTWERRGALTPDEEEIRDTLDSLMRWPAEEV